MTPKNRQELRDAMIAQAARAAYPDEFNRLRGHENCPNCAGNEASTPPSPSSMMSGCCAPGNRPRKWRGPNSRPKRRDTQRGKTCSPPLPIGRTRHELRRPSCRSNRHLCSPRVSQGHSGLCRLYRRYKPHPPRRRVCLSIYFRGVHSPWSVDGFSDIRMLRYGVSRAWRRLRGANPSVQGSGQDRRYGSRHGQDNRTLAGKALGIFRDRGTCQ